MAHLKMSAHGNDKLTLTLGDIVRLILGRQLKVGALEIKKV